MELKVIFDTQQFEGSLGYIRPCLQNEKTQQQRKTSYSKPNVQYGRWHMPKIRVLESQGRRIMNLRLAGTTRKLLNKHTHHECLSAVTSFFVAGFVFVVVVGFKTG